jgi:hypothetical protein
LKREAVQNRITQLEQRFGGVKVIVGVDRLDYIKGVPQKLHALELFLTQHPEWIGKVIRFFFYLVSLFNDQLLVSGCLGPARCAVKAGRRGVSEPAFDSQRTCRPYQWQVWHCRVHADTLYAQELSV